MSRIESLNKFLREDKCGLLCPDVEKLRELSAEDFKSGYVGDMERHIGYYGRDGEREKFITCNNCVKPITSGRDLIRYFGDNLHHACFSEVYEMERDANKSRISLFEKDYFDLIKERVLATGKSL